LFWRFKRAKASHHGSRVNTHSFLFDDDEDTERSIPTTTPTPYAALPNHSQNRSNYLSRQNSNNNFPFHSLRKSSVFNCCGFTIDLSNKHSEYSSNGDATSRRSTVCKSFTNTNNNNNNSPAKFRTYSHSPMSLSSFDRQLQQKVSYKSSNDSNQSTARRRATTVVHCVPHLPSSTVTSLANQSLTLDGELSSVRRSISKERDCSSFETLPPDASDLSPIQINVFNTDINPTKDIKDSIVFVQNHLQEEQLPAYIVETC
jgi:hypothetical protein